MDPRELLPNARWKTALNRVREWIHSNSAPDQMRVTDPSDSQPHTQPSPRQPSQATRESRADAENESWSTRVRQHEAHPHSPSSGEAPEPEFLTNHGYSARDEDLAPRDSMADAMAQRMLQGALGGAPEDDDDIDREVGMHIERVAGYGDEGDVSGSFDDDMAILLEGDVDASLQAEDDASVEGDDEDFEPAPDSLPPLDLQRRKARPTTHH